MSHSWSIAPLSPPTDINSGSSISPNLLSLPQPLLPEIHTGPVRKHKKADTARVPRPLNSFMMYRKEKQHEVLARYPNVDNRDISRIVAEWWNAEPDSVKKEFRARAEKAKKEHMEKYPGYKYRPRKRSVSSSSSSSSSGSEKQHQQQQQYIPVALSCEQKKPFILLDPMALMPSPPLRNDFVAATPFKIEQDLYFVEKQDPLTPELHLTPQCSLPKEEEWECDQYFLNSGKNFIYEEDPYWQNWQRMSKTSAVFEPGMVLSDFYL